MFSRLEISRYKIEKRDHTQAKKIKRLVIMYEYFNNNKGLAANDYTIQYILGYNYNIYKVA